jgi:hypothetical protein
VVVPSIALEKILMAFLKDLIALEEFPTRRSTLWLFRLQAHLMVEFIIVWMR